MSFKQIEIKGTVANGEVAPTLEQLKTGNCTKKQLQAAVVQLIEIVNMNQVQFKKWADGIEAGLAKKQDRPWRASM